MHGQNSKQEFRDVLGNLISVSNANCNMTYDIMDMQFSSDGYESVAQAISILIHQSAFNQELQERVMFCPLYSVLLSCFQFEIQ